jgi:hypothetical protein
MESEIFLNNATEFRSWPETQAISADFCNPVTPKKVFIAVLY